MSLYDEAASHPDAALTALLGAVLRHCAADPVSLLAGGAMGSAVIRIGRGAGESGAQRFDELLLETFDSTADMLRAVTAKRIGNRPDAEDLVQTAFMRVYAAKPDVADVDELRAYLWTVTTNLTRDAWRRAAADRDQLDPDGDERVVQLAAQAGLELDDLVALRETLLTALDTLPRREREALVFRAYEGNTYAETARIMGVSTGAVKSYVHDAMLRMRKRLDAVA
ncbi:RNA polymerase sigma factor [Nocardia sp. CA-135953]|uniref:RNA polymerase sigma factor n=1 Tax=Nocardia sp. CA-135953 TaxID=3239978 RepID=UPI003D99ED2F